MQKLSEQNFWEKQREKRNKENNWVYDKIVDGLDMYAKIYRL